MLSPATGPSAPPSSRHSFSTGSDDATPLYIFLLLWFEIILPPQVQVARRPLRRNRDEDGRVKGVH